MRSRTLWSVPSKLSANFALDAHHYCCALCVSLLQNVKYGEIHWIYSAEPNITGEWQQQSNLHLKSSLLGVSFPLTFPSFFLICVFSCLLFQSFRSFSCQLSCLLIVIRFVLVFIFSLVPFVWFYFYVFLPTDLSVSIMCHSSFVIFLMSLPVFLLLSHPPLFDSSCCNYPVFLFSRKPTNQNCFLFEL